MGPLTERGSGGRKQRERVNSHSLFLGLADTLRRFRQLIPKNVAKETC